MVIEVEDESVITERLKLILSEAEKTPVRTDQKSLPSWFDPDKFKRGQQYFRKNYFVMFVAKLSGLLLVLSVPSVLKVLVLTGKSSDPAKAFRRYMDTVCNMLDWYTHDIADVQSKSFRTLIKVRGQHCAAGRKSLMAGYSAISQRDMVLTQFGFMGICLSKGNYLGMKGDEKDVEGFIHFWKTIGYFMGVDDKYNLCSGETNQVLKVCEKIRSQVFKSFMQKPPERFDQMSDALLQGVRPVIPFLHPNAFMKFCQLMVDINPEKPLSGLYARFIFRLQIIVHTILLTVWYLSIIFKPFLNGAMRLTIFLNSKFPFLASITLGNDVYPEKAEPVLNNNLADYSNVNVCT